MSTSIQQRSYDFYSLGGVGGPFGLLVRSARRDSSLFARGRAGGRTYKRIAMLVDNCCACLVFCWLISIIFCVTLSFILCVVLFCNKILYNITTDPSRRQVESEPRVASRGRRDNNGPKIDPCGTPLRTCSHFDTLPFRTTLCCLPYKPFSIQLSTVKHCHLYHMPLIYLLI